jgi:tetratricopeptide (TPR) repeat protein
MVAKVLHAGSIAVAFAAVATAADVTFTMGAGTAITTALAGLEIFKKADPSQKTIAQKMAQEMQSYLGQSHLTAGRKNTVIQVAIKFPPKEIDIATGNRNAETVATNICTAITALKESDANIDPALTTPTALSDYAALLIATLTPSLEPVDQASADGQVVLERTADINGKLDGLMAQLAASGEEKRLLDVGISETTIIKLARRTATDTQDLEGAWAELQNAMEIAVRVQEDGHKTSNHGDFVDEVMRRVAELAAEGEYASASAEIDAALEDEVAASEARQLRLMDQGIDIALLDGDSAGAAKLLVRKADMEGGGQVAFDDLRALRRSYFEKGRDKGIALDLKVSIDLAQITLARATTADERGIALNDLATSLKTLGARDSDTKRLEQAVVAFERALEEWTQDRVPMDWAMTQNNLGAALRTLGERDSDTQRLEQAVEAFQRALEEYTQDRVPMDWAMTQNNLGTALATLGARDSDTARLEQAVVAFERALEERTQDRVPMDWAMTQNNLGNALKILGERDSDTKRLEQAVVAYQRALEELTQDRVPMNWATAQNNLGNALRTLGARDSDTQRLEQAVQAYERALEEWTQDRVPMNWAMTQFNLAEVELAFFEKTGLSIHLDRAQGYADAAHGVFEAASASYYLGLVQRQRAAIAKARATVT